MVDEFERTWTFHEMVRALASQPPLPGLTPLSRDAVGARKPGASEPTAEVIVRMLEAMRARQKGARN